MKTKQTLLCVFLTLSGGVVMAKPTEGTEEATAKEAERPREEGEIHDLEEVVVTGQGTAIQKRRLSTSVQTLSGAKLEHLPTARIDQLLQAAMPNLNTRLSSGQPGATSLMMSRGLSSAYSNSTPVIYVDGIRVDNNNTASALSNDLNGGNFVNYEGQAMATSSVADIPMENIERIEYVSGGAATTLYGSDAANGVIQIFTRKGGEGRFSGTFSADLGVEVANADFYRFKQTASLLHQHALLQRYRLSAEGGTAKGGWSVGASMSHTPGTIVGDANEQKRYDVRFGAHYQALPWLTYRTSFGTVLNSMRYARNGNEGLYSGLWTLECGAVTGQWWTDADGLTHNYSADIDQITDPTAWNALQTLVKQGEGLSDHRETVRRFQTSHTLEATPLKGLTIKATLGVDYRYSSDKYTLTNAWREATQQTASLPVSSMRLANRDYLGFTFDGAAAYSVQTDNGWSSVTSAGFQFFSTDDHQSSLFGKDLRDGSLTINGAATRTSDEWLSSLHNEGIYLQENLGYRDRYFLDLGLRTDYNSGFGDHVGWQWYPKVGLSYLVSDEKALQEVSWLDMLKVFANYGVAGLYPPAFSYQRTVSFSSYQGGLAATFGQYGNDDLGPEKRHSTEVGFLSRFFGRFTFGLTYYYALTRDALFNVPLPPSVGEGNSLANVGKIENKGIEMEGSYDVVKNKDWDVTLRASLNTNHNKVLSTGGATTFAVGGFSASTIQSVVTEGKPVGYLRASRTTLQDDGTAKTETYQDLGRTTPTLYGSFGLDARYRHCRFYLNGDYQSGGHVHSYNAMFLFRKGVKDDRVPEALLMALGMAEDGSNRAAIQKANWTNLTNYFVYNADFAKIRQIGADYTFEKPCKGLRHILLGFNVENPFCFTSCPVDPEATISTTLQQGGIATGGFNYATYSAPRRYVFTLQVAF